MGPELSKRIDVGDRTYEVRAWPHRDFVRWTARLTRIAGGAAGDHGTDAAALGALLAQLDEKLVLEFDLMVEKQSALVTEEDGRETVLPLDANVHLRGRPEDWLALVWEHGAMNFLPFLRGLAKRIADAKALAGASQKGS